MLKDVDAEVWQSLGEQDADWAVASNPGRKHGGWEGDLDTFYAEGEDRITKALALTRDVSYGRALDWGAGTGRLTFALARRFEHVTAVDISTSMQDLLVQRSAARGVTNVEPVLVPDFAPAADVDFAVSLITMQHFPDRATVKSALEAMAASLKPRGNVVVEIPSRAHTLRYRVQLRYRVYRVLRRLGVSPKRLHSQGFSGIKMLCVPSDWVVGVLESAGVRVHEITEHRGTSHQFVWYAGTRADG